MANQLSASLVFTLETVRTEQGLCVQSPCGCDSVQGPSAATTSVMKMHGHSTTLLLQFVSAA